MRRQSILYTDDTTQDLTVVISGHAHDSPHLLNTEFHEDGFETFNFISVN